MFHKKNERGQSVNNSRFFSNKECEYYPCHESGEDINCLFCYCPLYLYECPGNYRITEKDGKKIKNCRECTFPHEKENFEKVIAILKGKPKLKEEIFRREDECQ
ncbi:MAG: cysteine-rich small domain-containing protein [Lachnospiraceae bacterium]|nr:cysteine-rich small domain-containing protein [Lachnospiraceae bacterium]